MKNLYLQLLDLLSLNQELALATVTATVGSTPQKPGSSAIFNTYGLAAGTVGGGLVEGKIQQLALNSLTSRESGYFQYTLNRDSKNGEDALCGGKIEIMVDASPSDHFQAFEQLKDSIGKRIPGVLATTAISLSGDKISVKREWLTEEKSIPAGSVYTADEIKRLIRDQNPGQYVHFELPDSGQVFLEPVFPPPHLIIAGAGHIGKALTHIGKLLDFEVTVADDREEYANPGNLPDADHIIVNDVGATFEEMTLGPDSYVVIVTRGHKDDSKALRACIGTDAAYVGMIGSKNKVSQLRTEFIQKGWAEPREWKDIYAPIGLGINSKSVEEIAISIAAQLIQVKNTKLLAHE